MEIWKIVTKKTRELIGLKCDTCGGILDWGGIQLIVSEKEEKNKYDFCSYRCLEKFVIAEKIKLEPTDDRFIYGKKETK